MISNMQIITTQEHDYKGSYWISALLEINGLTTGIWGDHLFDHDTCVLIYANVTAH